MTGWYSLKKAGGYRKYTGKHRAARTGVYLLLLWPAFNHIRRGGSCYSPTVRNAIIWTSEVDWSDGQSSANSIAKAHRPWFHLFEIKVIHPRVCTCFKGLASNSNSAAIWILWNAWHLEASNQNLSIFFVSELMAFIIQNFLIQLKKEKLFFVSLFKELLESHVPPEYWLTQLPMIRMSRLLKSEASSRALFFVSGPVSPG